jgi:hypothetical protein
MISIKKLLKEIEDMSKSNIASIQDPSEWKMSEIEHLKSMKFNNTDESIFVLDSPPIKVYKQKNGPFVVEEPIENHEKVDFKVGMSAPVKPKGLDAFKHSKQIKQYQFQKFNDVVEFFDKYKQNL